VKWWQEILHFFGLMVLVERRVPVWSFDTTTPKLNQVLEAIHDLTVQQAKQQGGPDLNAMLQISVDCRDDETLCKVLETKGGKLTIEINLIPDLTDDKQLAKRMQHLRTTYGVKQNCNV
jgi:hypothetical protein